MTDIDLGSKRLFSEQPNQNNYVTIATVVAGQIPLANIFNGQAYLVELTKRMTQNAQQNASSINFGDIQKVLQFKMFKVSRAKAIFSAYISRVLPDTTQSNVAANQYYPSVQFKIDYDTCCVGSMMCLLTTDIQVRGTLGEININGFTAHGNNTGITLNYDKDVKSIQYQYCTDFIYHYIDRICLGFANTGGNAPVWHQEVPIEIAKIYHTILSPPGMSETIARAVREDMFIIGHDPHRQFGDFSFQMKSPASIPSNTQANVIAGGSGLNFGFNQQIQSSQTQYSTNNELAMYWNDTEIKEVGFAGLTNSNSYSNPNNIQILFKDPKSTGSTIRTQIDTDKDRTKVITKMDLSTELYWRLGSDNSIITINPDTDKYMMTSSLTHIPIISDIQGLVPIINGLTPQSGYIHYTNTIDAVPSYNEDVYLIPYILYSTDKIQFGSALITKLNNNKLYKTGGAQYNVQLNTPGNNNDTIFTNKVVIDVADQGHNGQMTYDLTGPTVQINGADVDGVNCIAVLSQYELTISQNSFVLSALSGINPLSTNYQSYYLKTTLINFTEGKSVVSEGTGPDAGFKKCIMSSIGFNSQMVSLLDFMTATAQTMGSYLLQSTGALSPLMQQANIAYINIVAKPYDQNDLMLNSPTFYTMANGTNMQPIGSDRFAVFRYNAALACNGQSEENYPAIKNIDDVSIHTFRKNHGIVDFLFPLQFLFICQDISQSFPHYACSAQSILVKFEFNNPLAFINTSLAVRPLAVDPMDFGHNERILLNRVNTRDILQSNINNTKFVLYYTRYAWVPILQPILANYKHYTWVTNNYERFYKIYENLPTNQQITLCEFNKSNFYTRVWAFVVNRETIEVINNKGGPMEYVPIYVNRFNLESWDKLRFGSSTQITSQGAALTGNSAQQYIGAQNSVYFQVPFDSCQLVTKTSINMTDDMPYRTQMLYPYLMLEHQQLHSALKSNNTLMFNIDSVFYQEGFPNCMYSPAYAPDFALKCTTKSGQQQDFGMIIIPEYKNISFISSHVMLMKYSSNQ